MNSTKTNWKWIENITVEVINATSISKDIFSHVSKFLEKMVFQLMFEIIMWIRQLQFRRQTVPNYWRQIGQFVWTEHVFLKERFSFKTADLVFAWFWPDCLCKSWKYRGKVSLKNLKALEERYWSNLSETGSHLIFSKSFIPVWLLLSSWG